jgi:hypothetical protein
MDARLVGERIGTDDRLVRLDRKTGDRADQARRLGDVLGDDPGLIRQQIVAGAQRHHDLFHGRVAGALADAVDGALDLARARLDRAQRVRHAESQIVVAMHRDHRLVDVRHAVPDHPDQIGEFLGVGVAHRVRDVDRGGAGLDRALDAAAQEIVLGARPVLAGPFHVVAVAPRAGHAVDHRLVHLLGRLLQLDRHVQRAGRDEGVDAFPGSGLERLGGAVDVGAAGARQRADHAVLDLLGDLVDRAKVALGRDRESSLDHVHAHLLEQIGDLQLLGDGHRGARRLLAVAQRGIEDDDAVFVRGGVAPRRGGYGTRRLGRHGPGPFGRMDASLITRSP